MTYDEMEDWYEEHTDLDLETATPMEIFADMQYLFAGKHGRIEEAFPVITSYVAAEYGGWEPEDTATALDASGQARVEDFDVPYVEARPVGEPRGVYQTVSESVSRLLDALRRFM